jgi:alpha-ketoglutaric semialdehyde dehydrogenase
MKLEKVLIAGEWRESKNPDGQFHAVNPAKKTELPESYPVSGEEDVRQLLEAGKKAADELRKIVPDRKADFLERYADKIEALTDELVEIASLETALAREPRLRNIELPRTTNQLRKAAAAARERSWCRATIDTETNIRSQYGSLGGPVVIFGPNNFPYAYNAMSGGDFAGAIATGNPVIAKAHPAHPGTTRVLARAALEAVIKTGLPVATVQMIYHVRPELGFELVSHPVIGASAFTGSRSAGLKLKEAADHAGKPVYLEMSSVNPVFILPGAIKARCEAIAAELFSSCTLAAGQFCTNPGLIFLIKGQNTESFTQAVSEQFANGTPGTLLTSGGPDNISTALNSLTSAGAQIIVGGQKVETEGYSFANTLLRVEGQTFLKNPEALQTEAFGTVSLLVIAEDVPQMRQMAMVLKGNLTASIYSDLQGSDDGSYQMIEPELRIKVGRLLNDKMPTGVAVVPSMNHGGPYPATGHPGFTAVGFPGSMIRFAALHCYDHVRPHRLPAELQDQNPTGAMWRMIDGEWTRRNIQSAGFSDV